MLADIICKRCGKAFRAKTMPSKPRNYCSRSCGNRRVSGNRRHGLTDTPEHRVWRGMRQRCNSPVRQSYARYGGRGIKVCERWNDFANFLADMGKRPGGPEFTIERIDNDGHYEPSNCKWATQAEQNRNKSNIYTAEENQKIREAIALGLNFRQVAAFVGRSEKGVTARAYRMGLSSGWPVPAKITDRVKRTPQATETPHE